jgi:hypothetical protein
MSDGYFIDFAAFVCKKNIFTGKLLVAVAQQGAGQKMRFAKDLETIANTKYLSSRIGKVNDTLHHGAKAGYGAATQIIAKRKSPGKYDAIFCTEHAEIFVFMPEHDHILPKIMFQRIMHIAIAIRTGENYNTKSHNEYLL